MQDPLESVHSSSCPTLTTKTNRLKCEMLPIYNGHQGTVLKDMHDSIIAYLIVPKVDQQDQSMEEKSKLKQSLGENK